jgi:hypothetical protein
MISNPEILPDRGAWVVVTGAEPGFAGGAESTAEQAATPSPSATDAAAAASFGVIRELFTLIQSEGEASSRSRPTAFSISMVSAN